VGHASIQPKLQRLTHHHKAPDVKKSGVPDFDTDAYRAFQYHHNLVDMSPLDIFGWVHGALMFNPGDVPLKDGHGGGMSYCSVNFLLLGYVLAYHAGVDSWGSFDQRSSLPAVAQKRMSGLEFPTKGPCKDWTRVHGFDTGPIPLFFSWLGAVMLIWL
jgi:hypothetical protein